MDDERAYPFEMEPRPREAYAPFMELVESARTRYLRKYSNEVFHIVSPPESPEYLAPLRIYPETALREAGTFDGQLHYFLHKDLESPTPHIRLGMEIERLPPDSQSPPARNPHYSWDFMKNQWRHYLLSPEVFDMREANFKLLGGFTKPDGDHELINYDDDIALKNFLNDATDDEVSYFFRFERLIPLDELHTWNPNPDTQLVNLLNLTNGVMFAFIAMARLQYFP